MTSCGYKVRKTPANIESQEIIIDIYADSKVVIEHRQEEDHQGIWGPSVPVVGRSRSLIYVPTKSIRSI
jgi:hypothetical protein